MGGGLASARPRSQVLATSSADVRASSAPPPEPGVTGAHATVESRPVSQVVHDELLRPSNPKTRSSELRVGLSRRVQNRSSNGPPGRVRRRRRAVDVRTVQSPAASRPGSSSTVTTLFAARHASAFAEAVPASPTRRPARERQELLNLSIRPAARQQRSTLKRLARRLLGRRQRRSSSYDRNLR